MTDRKEIFSPVVNYIKNPWIDITESDYTGHMSDPSVNQRPVLNRLFSEAVTFSKPENLLVLGSCTGNGMEHVDPRITSRVECVDINPAFVSSLKNRFAHTGLNLFTHCMDVMDFDFGRNAYDLIQAALIFEYVDWKRILPRISASLTSEGMLSAVLQRPSDTSPAVTPTPYTSLSALESVFNFVEPGQLISQAQQNGLRLHRRHTEPLPSGKSFEVLHFIRVSEPGQGK